MRVSFSLLAALVAPSLAEQLDVRGGGWGEGEGEGGVTTDVVYTTSMWGTFSCGLSTQLLLLSITIFGLFADTFESNRLPYHENHNGARHYQRIYGIHHLDNRGNRLRRRLRQ